MDLVKLNYFRVVAEYEHITKAAEYLHISQPSLSATIARLEEELGVPLFDRSRNKIKLNESGRIFLRHVNRMYTELNFGLEELKKNHEKGTGRISFSTFGPGITNDLIPRFMLSYPNISVTHTVSNLEEMMRQLDNGTIDFAISTNPAQYDDYNWDLLYTDTMLVLLPATHPLAGKRVINLRELSHERFGLFNADKSSCDVTIQLCNRAGFTPDVIYDGNEISLILTLVASNVCIFLCSAANGVFGKDDPRTSTAKSTICSSLCYPNTQIPVGILTRRDKELSPPVRKFIELVKESYAHIGTFEYNLVPPEDV